MPISNFPNGFSNGVVIRGVPVSIAQPGRVFWLNNSSTVTQNGLAGSDNNPGTYQKPFATLKHAVAMCVASRGDTIMVMPGHAETFSSATAIAMNVAGVAVVGLGTGSTRPTFTLDTANTATIPVSAANVSFQNCRFVANFLNIAALFTLTTAADFTVDNCNISDTSGILNFLIIVKTDTTSNHADGLHITNNFISLQATSGVVNLVSALGTNDRWLISGNYFASLTTNAAAVIPIAAGKILTNFRLLNNRFNVVNAAGTGTGYIITTNGSTNSGFIDGNFDHALPTTPLFCTASSGFVYGANYHSDQADLQGYLVPAADV